MNRQIIGWGRTNGSLCAIIQCDVLKFEENPARIKLFREFNFQFLFLFREIIQKKWTCPVPSECVIQNGPVEVGDAVEIFEEIKPFWITGRICAKLSNGLICDEWPPKGCTAH